MTIIKPIAKFFKKHYYFGVIGLVIGVLLTTLSPMKVQWPALDHSSESSIGQGQVAFIIGTQALAAGLADYTFNGDPAHDTTQMQTALNALPASGGRLVVLNTGNVTFNALVTRAIPNVTISGIGRSTQFNRDGINPVFSAGGTGWKFDNLITDAGGITLLSDTVLENVQLGPVRYALKDASGSLQASSIVTMTANISTLNAPTGRSSTFIVAASNAPAQVKAQADYVVTTNATATILAAISAAGNNSLIQLSTGLFNLDTEILISSADNVTIQGSGWGTVLRRTDKMIISTIPGAFLWGDLIRVYNSNRISIRDLAINGNYTNQIKCSDGNHPGAYWGLGPQAEDWYNNIFIQSSNYCSVDDVYSYDSGTNNIRIGASNTSPVYTASTHNYVLNSLVTGGRNGVLTYGSSAPPGGFNTIASNKFLNGKGYAGIYIYSSNDTVIGNEVSGYFNSTEVASDGIRTVATTSSQITENTVIGNQEYGIQYFGGNGTIVSGNLVKKNGLYGIGGAASQILVTGNVIDSNYIGISVGGYDQTISGNQITNNLKSGISVTPGQHNLVVNGNIILHNGAQGILTSTSLNGFTIINNRIADNEWDATVPTRAGIYFNGDSGTSPDTNGVIENNIFEDTGIGAERFGIWAYGNVTATIQGNIFRNLTNQPVLLDNPAGIMTFKNNIGYVTENSGNVTMGAGLGAVDVTHGLVVVPTNVTATIYGNPGVGTTLYTGNFSSTKFTIYVTTNFSRSTPIFWKATGNGN